MNYELVFGKNALAGLVGQVPGQYFDCIYAALLDLSGDPTNHAQRCDHPYPGRKQFDFDCTHQSHGFVFRAYFYFGPGEKTIRVFDMTATASW